MAKLLERVEYHLRRIQRIETANVLDVDVALDFAGHEAALYRCHVEYAESNPAAAHRLGSLWDRELNRHWLDHCIDELHWELLAGFGSKLLAQARAELIESALCVMFVPGYEHAELGEDPRSARLRSLADDIQMEQTAWKTSFRWHDVYPWQIISRYCEHLGLTSARPSPPQLRTPGHTWLRLRGLDRLRWLLALESVHAAGNDDPWCVSESQIRWIAEHADRVFDDERDPDLLGWKQSSVSRWAALGVLQEWVDHDDDTFGYRLTEAGRQLFDPATADIATLFQNLARAQAEDARAETFQAFGLAESSAGIAATTMRHARLVAHEVRNALLPVRHALDKVWRQLDGSEIAGGLAEPRSLIDDGITRLYRFVEASARMSATVDELPADFLVLDALGDARRELSELSGRIRLEIMPGTANPRCRGHRGRFALALINLMRNSVQIGGAGVEIRIRVDATDPACLTLTIADDGPGVPDQLREQVFTNGVSSRADGSGHGLALVREVIEQELGGSVTLEPADGGGARFRLTLPSVEAHPDD